MSEPYRYTASVKSNLADEPVNTLLLRPLAGLLVRLLYRTSITPNQVTLAATGVGLVSAALFATGGAVETGAAGTLILFKDILDSADGQLARAKNQYSRAGRFLDSIGDFVVNCFLFAAIGWSLFRSSDTPTWFLLAGLGLLGITLRVSYHVYYMVSFLHLEGRYDKNRITEEITEEDRRGDRGTLRLQQIFLRIYGWQDRMMKHLDEWCRGDITASLLPQWYGDRTALRLSGFLGFGTEYSLLMIASLFGRTDLYLSLNLVGLNALWGACVIYRRWGLRNRLETGEGA